MPHTYATSREKRIDMWLGFAGWLALAVLLLLATTLIRPAFADGSVLGPLIYLTIGAALLLLITRPYAAFGLLLAPATVVGLLIVEVLFFLASMVFIVATGAPHGNYCSAGQAVCIGPASTTVAMVIGLATFLVAAWFSLRGIDRRVR